MTVPFPIFSVDVVPVELTDKGRLMTKVVPLSLAWELVRLVVPFQSDRKPEDPVPVILPVEAEGVQHPNVALYVSTWVSVGTVEHTAIP